MASTATEADNDKGPWVEWIDIWKLWMDFLGGRGWPSLEMQKAFEAEMRLLMLPLKTTPYKSAGTAAHNLEN